MVKVRHFLKTDSFINYNPLNVWKCHVTHVWKWPYVKMHSVLCTNIHYAITFLVNHGTIRCYLCYKTILAIKWPFISNYWFFLFEEKNALFTRYVDFCVFMKSTNFKICDIIIGIVMLISFESLARSKWNLVKY